MNKTKLNKKVMLFSIILVFVICLGCASASENIDDNSTDEVLTTQTEDVGTDNQVLTADATNDIGSNDTQKSNEDILKSTNTNEKLSADSYTLNDLSTLIKVNPTSVSLDRDVVYNVGSDSPLEISKNNMVIDFNNHKLDANGYTGTVLTISGNNVTIKNMNLINAIGTRDHHSNSGYGGYTHYTANLYPVVWSGTDGKLQNSIFNNNQIGVKWTGDYGSITDSLFKDSLYEQIYATGNNFRVTRTDLLNITGFGGSAYCDGESGMGITSSGESSVISYCNINTNANGMTVSGCDVKYCNFTNIKMALSISAGTASNCIFEGCSFQAHVTKNSGMHYFNRVMITVGDGAGLEYCTVKNCIFNTNPAEANNRAGMFNINDNAFMRYCDIVNSTFGGLITVNMPYSGFQYCNFINNTVTSYFLQTVNNGRTPVKKFDNAYFESCNFEGNKFNVGFILDASGTNRIYNCNFTNNIVTGSHLTSSSDTSSLNLINCRFAINYEEWDGWAIKLSSSSMHLIVDTATVFNNVTHHAISPDTYDSSSFMYLYVNQTGGGTGLSKDSPTDWNTAIASVSGFGVIEFVNNNQEYIYNSSLVINKIVTLKGNGVVLNGITSKTIMNFASSHITITNFTFINAHDSFGAIACSDAGMKYYYSSTIDNCTFKDNNGNWAGAINWMYSYSNSPGNTNNLFISNCKFINNTATSYRTYSSDGNTGVAGSYDAGAILIGSGTVVNCSFDSNSGIYTGAISSTYSSGVFIEDCNFTNNNASNIMSVSSVGQGGYGTAGAVSLHVVDTSSYVKGCKFINNTAPLNGALNVQGSGGSRGVVAYGKVNVSDCVFVNNTSTGAVGAVMLFSKDAYLTNCSFINNTAMQHGGAVYLLGDTHIDRCSFINNTAAAGSGGGAISAHSTITGLISISNSNFTGNNNMVIYIFKQGLAMTNSNFTKNIGGCLIVEDLGNSGVNIANSIFADNKDVTVYSSVKTIISNSNFTGNNASIGGAVYIGGTDSHISGSNFTGNNAGIGGALYLTGDNIEIIDCRFIKNNATSTEYGGGAIFDDGNYTIILNSYFSDNFAVCHGGALYINKGYSYAIDRETILTFIRNVCLNKTGMPSSEDWDNIYDDRAKKLLSKVYVVLNPDSWLGLDNIVSSSSGDSWENATDIDNGFNLVAPKGHVIFVNSSEVYVGISSLTSLRVGVVVEGNDTILVNHQLDIINDNVEIHDFTFCDNNGHSAIIWQGNNGLIDNCVFKSNVGSYLSGVCVFVNGNNLIIKNSSFIDNELSFANDGDSGGALFVNASGLSISDCVFDNNTANDGAHIYLTENANNVVISDSYFANGDGVNQNGQGIVVCSEENVQIINCNFTSNCVFYDDAHPYDGAGVLVSGNVAYLIFKGNIFVNNSATGKGGAIAFVGNPTLISVTDNVFINNSAGYGGSLYLNGQISLSNSKFFNNSAINGSAIYIVSINGVLEDLSFAAPKYNENNNVIPGYIYSTNAVTLKNAIFSFTDLNKTVSEANTILDLEYKYKYFKDYDVPFKSGVSIDKTLSVNGHSYRLDGSGLARVFQISADNVDLSNLTFVDACVISGNGGAILWSGNNGSMSDSFFINCSAVNAGSARNYGGAVSISGANMNINVCAFDSCVSNVGSVIRINNGNSVITNCNFTNNNADQYDGVIWYDGTNSEDFILSDCIFKGNNASRWGGALRVDSKGSINNCIFENNAVVYSNKTSSGAGNGYGGAIYLTGSGVSITNSTFKGNYVDNLTSMCGGGIYASKAFTLSNCYFMNNSASNGSAVYYVSNSDLNIDSCTFANPRYDQINNWLEGYIYSTGVINFNNVSLSFTDLNHTIANSGNSLDLLFNYMFFNEFDEKFISGVPISKDFTINGNNFILDGNHSARIFNITGDNTVFSNLTFRNGNATLGGAIYVIGIITVLNSNFTNNSAVLGGAIFIEGGYSNFTNCIFDANNATNGSAIYIITSVNHWDNLDFINNIASTNATIYFREDSTVYSDNLTFANNIIPNMLNIVGENHIYSPRIYVNQTHPGFGIIMSEPTSLTRAVDNILDNGIIIICSDYTLETIIKLNNLTNVTVTGNHTLRKDKYQFILPKSWGKIRILKLLHQKPITLN